MGLDSF